MHLYHTPLCEYKWPPQKRKTQKQNKDGREPKSEIIINGQNKVEE